MMKKNRTFSFITKALTIVLISCLNQYPLNAQNNESIRGMVVDKASGKPIGYANIITFDSQVQTGTVTDSLGYFRLTGLSVGRYNVKISFMGYEPYILKEVAVSSGKETRVEVTLKENAWELDDIVVRPQVNKEQPLNKMAAASARMFSVEEANRYAGGLDDPARLVSSFAGVAGSISTNGITVRGNSPQFLQWRLEGVEIPNPTHFPDLTGIGGGIITALSSQVLGNSDFLTGAFPAEYGNALSGVFDVRLRTGNNQKRESTFQLGTIGIDLASEGPFRKGGRASYLFNYRYSSLSLIDKIIPGGLGEAGGIKYQDLSFKLNFPTRKTGIFSIWGIGTIDRYSMDAKDDSTAFITEDDKISNTAYQYMGAAGVGHKIFLPHDAYLQTNLAVTHRSTDLRSRRTDSLMHRKLEFDLKGYNLDIILNSYINKKFSARHTNRTGFSIKGLLYDIDYNMVHPHETELENFAKDNGNSVLFEAFTSSAIELTPTLTAVIGLNGKYFTLNDHWTLEPRASLKWRFAPRQSVSLAYGMHSRHEKIDYYFTKLHPDGKAVNLDLDFTKAHHIVLAYDRQLSDNVHLKIEPYFQYLFDVPVVADSSFSMINHRLWYLLSKLENKGNGINYGIDVTLERYMNNGYYYMFTGSLFNSRYKGGDGIWRNTRLNRNYLLNVLGGKEWFLGKTKRKVLGVNLRFSLMGGERYTPVHPDATPETVVDRTPLLDETRAYELRQTPVFISNFTVTYKINRKNYAHEFAVKVLNANGYKEFLGYTYDYRKQAFVEVKEAYILPSISYTIDF